MKNFEQKIKEDLAQREITPSENAWERIALEIQPQKKKRGFPWMFIAASFLLVGLASLFFWNTNKANHQEPTQWAKETPNQPINVAEEAQQETTANTINQFTELQLTQDKKESKSNLPISNVKKETSQTKIIVTQKEVYTVEETPQEIKKESIIKDEKLVQEQEPISTPLKEPMLALENTTKKETTRKQIKVNREKLLFMMEKEAVKKSAPRLTFTGNSIAIELKE